MKIAHLADSHLGHTGHGTQRLVEDPWRPGMHVRQREADLMAGLAQAVDRVLDTVRPELVIHSGDLFDGAQPAAHVLDFAMTQLGRLADVGIPVLLVEGNHSFPRDRSRGHILRVLSHLRGVTVVCDEPARVTLGGVLIDAFPHRALSLGRLPDRAGLSGTGANVLVAHAVANGLPFFKTSRPGADLAVSEYADWYDLVALGHCHRFWQVPGTDRAFYAGATAMVSSGDFWPGHRFGLNVVTLGGGAPEVRQELLDTRPMRAYGLDDATDLSPQDVLAFLARQAHASPPADSYCQVIVEGLNPLARRELATRDVEALFDSAAGLTVSLRVREQRWEAVRAGLQEGGDPVARFGQLVQAMDDGDYGDHAFRRDVLALGAEILEAAYADVGAEDLEEAGSAGTEEGIGA